MRSSLPTAQLEAYVRALVANHLPDGWALPQQLQLWVGRALERVDYCFSRIRRKYYVDQDEAVFDHLNSDHMVSFLWFLANTIWRETGDTQTPTRLFYLNKIMHSLDLFYSVQMPDVFMLVHPVGTVLGKAHYSNYFVAYQNCIVGADTDAYPRFGEGVVLYSRTSVIGNCAVGDNVVFAANSLVIDTSVPSNTLVVGQHPAQRFVPNRRSVLERCFGAQPAVRTDA